MRTQAGSQEEEIALSPGNGQGIVFSRAQENLRSCGKPQLRLGCKRSGSGDKWFFL